MIAGAAPSPFDAHYGLRLTHEGDGAMEGEVALVPALMQPHGIVHGGVHAAVAEALASLGTERAVAARGGQALGMSNHTSFLRPVGGGVLRGSARAIHRGRTTWVWDVELRDDAERLCATSRVTVAVRRRRTTR